MKKLNGLFFALFVWPSLVCSISQTVKAQEKYGTNSSIRLHYIYDQPKHSTIVPKEGEDIVVAPLLTRCDEEGNIHSRNWFRSLTYGDHFKVPEEVLEQDQDLARSVFTATTATGTARGSAFYAGNGWVITNAHVLAWSGGAAPQCGKFSVETYTGDHFSCERVEFCVRNSFEDLCLVKVNDSENLNKISPVLTLRRSVVRPTEEINIIGNPMDQGLSASRAFGSNYKLNGKVLSHKADAMSGSSGAPIFDINGEVVGLHFASVTSLWHGDPNWNGYAMSSNNILSLIKKNAPSAYAELNINESMQARRVPKERQNLKQGLQWGNFDRCSALTFDGIESI